MKKRIKNWWKSQWVSYKNVEPVYRLDKEKRIFYLTSPAGVISYRPKNDQDLCRFRDVYINAFEYVCFKSQDYFKLYRIIRKREKWTQWSLKANMRTRLKYRLRLWGNY